MKKNLQASATLLAATLSLLSNAASAEPVDEQTAARLAAQVMGSREAGKRVVRRQAPTRGDEATPPAVGAPAYYVYAGADGEGFVIIAGDDAVRPVLAYSPTGRTDELPPSMQQWLVRVEDQVAEARSRRQEPGADVEAMWTAATASNPVVLLPTAEWGQGRFYNTYCPTGRNAEKTLTGCVATAHAIVMRYYAYPASGKGTTPAYRTDTEGLEVAPRNVAHPYDWDDMPLCPDRDELTQAQQEKIAALMADVGASVQLDYGLEVTNGFMGRFGVYQNFDYSLGSCLTKDAFTEDQWRDMLQAELKARRPVLYRGEDAQGNNGHAFVLDGYSTDGLYHVNWGWYGYFNGFFALENLMPDDVSFSFGQAAQIGLMPMAQASAQPAVATVGGQRYASLLTALAAADQTGQEAVATANSLSGPITITRGRKLALDLAGKVLTLYGSIYNQGGTLTVRDQRGGGKMELQRANNCVISNSGRLYIKGGTFRNTSNVVQGAADYRRVIWSAEGSYTEITNGTFHSEGTTALCFNGDAKITGGTFTQNAMGSLLANYNKTGQVVIHGGTFTMSGNSSVISNYNTTGLLVIHGGTFVNDCAVAYDKDYRRVIWTNADSHTVINGGTFELRQGTQALCFNGEAEINWGKFSTGANSTLISNYVTTGPLVINGGEFTNTCTTKAENDYRRVLWADVDTRTVIRGGTFTNLQGTQTLCTRGEAELEGATLETPEGYDCLAAGTTVTIRNCKLGGKTNVYTSGSTAKVKVYTGIFSRQVDRTKLATGSTCVSNTNSATRAKYPYRVTNPNVGIITLEAPDDLDASSVGPDVEAYSLSGSRLDAPHEGLNILRTSDGKVRKNLYLLQK